MSCTGNTVETYSGDNTQLEVLFWEDEDQTVAHNFTAGSTVLWVITDSTGAFVQSFSGAVDATTLNKLTGTDSTGAPSVVTSTSYTLNARVTTPGGDLETVPSTPGSLALVVHPAIPTS